MRGAALSKNTTETLVQLFAELAVEQDRALLLRTISTVNKIYDKLEAI